MVSYCKRQKISSIIRCWVPQEKKNFTSNTTRGQIISGNFFELMNILKISRVADEGNFLKIFMSEKKFSGF